MEVTTEHKKLPKISTKSVKSSFFARTTKKASAEGQSPTQDLEVSPRSGLYLLVFYKTKNIYFLCLVTGSISEKSEAQNIPC